ncbi:hypothetical protein PIB30_059071 [Stylosanthes scabra]|uniref:FAD linked oxidase N-terminal domain-containing protein n=1 Tax=Stylosanthes scabra TaxID=79078 RepID=A0ABU6SLI4_9FABA|nr:hypothetical protein [Stylosanthes scabra]
MYGGKFINISCEVSGLTVETATDNYRDRLHAFHAWGDALARTLDSTFLISKFLLVENSLNWNQGGSLGAIKVQVDVENRAAWVQVGATVGELYYSIGTKTKTLGFPTGACPTIGVGGQFSSGGYGYLLRKYGLAADNIINAHIIDAKGRFLDREAMGEDLFWAIRGGGGASFGTVYSSINKGELTIQALFSGLFLGGVDKLVPLMQKSFPELGLAKEEYSFKAKSDYVRDPIPETGLEGLWCLMFEDEAQGFLLVLFPFGGMMSEIPESKIPFPHRDGVLYQIQYSLHWQEKGEARKRRGDCRKAYRLDEEAFIVIWKVVSVSKRSISQLKRP